MELPEGKSGQQAHLVEKLQKRAELMGAQKTGNWFVNCETYQAVATFSKCFCLLASLTVYTAIVLKMWAQSNLSNDNHHLQSDTCNSCLFFSGVEGGGGVGWDSAIFSILVKIRMSTALKQCFACHACTTHLSEAHVPVFVEASHSTRFYKHSEEYTSLCNIK